MTRLETPVRAAAAADVSPVLQSAIPLPGVEGRIDHLAIDERRARLYIAALGNDSVEVVDLGSRTHGAHLTGFHEPQGIGIDASLRLVVVANGETGTATLLDADTDRALKEIPVAPDADNVRVDESTHEALVGADGVLAWIDLRTGARVASVALPGHPESFQRGSDRLLVNVPDRRQVIVIGTRQKQILATWPVTAQANYPMAIDEAHRRVFIGCRRPARLLAFDLDSGRQTGDAEIDGDTDDLFYDSQQGRVLVICGTGVVDAVDATGTMLHVTARIPTAAGARTGLLSPARRALYVAVPHRGGQRAEIRVYGL